MNSKTNNIVFYAATGLLTLMTTASAGMYIFNHAEISKVFLYLGYPTHIIYPLAAAKIAGLIVIWTQKGALKEWAYAGFFFDFVLAVMAHLNIGDGEFAPAGAAVVLLTVSYFTGKKRQK